MNSGIYPKEIFEKEILRIFSKKYCHHCYHENDMIDVTKKTINESSVIYMKITINCTNCGKETTLVNKEEVGNLKIERVMKK